MFKPGRQAVDVALPKMGNVRALAIDTGGFTQDVDAIIATIASAATEQTISGAGLDGTIGASAMVPPRNVELVLDSHADWDATTAVVTGTNYLDASVTENLAIPNGGYATVAGVQLFKTIVSLYIPAQSGAGGTATLGTGLIASLEEWYGRYLTFISDVRCQLIAAPANAAITNPDANPSEVADNGVSALIPLDTYFSARPKTTDGGTSLTGAIKVVPTAAGTIWWWPSDNSDGD